MLTSEELAQLNILKDDNEEWGVTQSDAGWLLSIVDKLQADLKKESECITMYMGDAEDAEARVKELEAKLAESEWNVKGLKAGQEALRQLLDTVTRERDELKRELSEAVERGAYESLKSAHRLTVAEANRLKAERDGWKAVLEKVASEEHRAKRENAELKSQVAALRELVRNVRKHVQYDADWQYNEEWNSILASTADAARAWEKEVRREERERCAKLMRPMLRSMISRGEAVRLIRALGDE
jgi:chromosome segregation ATPase